jgi:hypothetical protein
LKFVWRQLELAFFGASASVGALFDFKRIFDQKDYKPKKQKEKQKEKTNENTNFEHFARSFDDGIRVCAYFVR